MDSFTAVEKTSMAKVERLRRAASSMKPRSQPDKIVVAKVINTAASREIRRAIMVDSWYLPQLSDRSLSRLKSRLVWTGIDSMCGGHMCRGSN